MKSASSKDAPVAHQSAKRASKLDPEALRAEARRERKREKAARSTYMDKDLRELIAEMDGEEVEDSPEEASARDVLYDNATRDFEEVSDEYRRKEVQGQLRMLGYMVNMYAKVVQGEEICPLFFDASGKVIVRDTKFHL